MNEVEVLVDTYCQGWSDSDPLVRERCIRETLAPQATYVDPRTDTLSIEQLLDHISRTVTSRPGAVVKRTSTVDIHHNLARFNWQVLLPDGTTPSEGIDFIELEDDRGRIRRIIGFFGLLTNRKG
jgi:hypothetical protein